MKKKKTISGYLCIVMLLFLLLAVPLPVRAATREKADNLMVRIDEGKAVPVKSLLVSSSRERYVSVRDMAVLLNESSKQFSVSVTKNKASIYRGESCRDETAGEPFTEEELTADNWYNPKSDICDIDGRESRYYGIIADFGEGYDCYLRLADLVMILNLDMQEEDGEWCIRIENDLKIRIEAMEMDGFFDGIDAAIAGDATTGEIYYAYQAKTDVPIASTTKLMTYLVLKDALHEGEIHENDRVVISENAASLSHGEDGVIKLEAGMTVDLKDLMTAILLPSSNESALALAEHLCGTEEAFVERMNEKAAELELYSADFYNCHGLPIYSSSTLSAKNQNHMSAEDMFRVVCRILQDYPEVTEITDREEAHLDSLSQFVKNTNGLLYNMPEVNGLKTGTTSKAGACLVASCEAEGEDGEIHTLVAIEYGAESNNARISYGETLIRYAKQEFYSPSGSREMPSKAEEKSPDTIEKLLWQILVRAREENLLE